MPEGFVTKFINADQLPLVVEPANKHAPISAMLQHLDQHHDFLKQALLKHGVPTARVPRYSVDDFFCCYQRNEDWGLPRLYRG